VLDRQESASDIDSVYAIPGLRGHLPNIKVILLVGDSSIGTQYVDGPKVLCCLCYT